MTQSMSPHPAHREPAAHVRVRVAWSRAKEALGRFMGRPALEQAGIEEQRAVAAAGEAQGYERRARRRQQQARVRIKGAQLASERVALEAQRQSEQDRSALVQRRRRRRQALEQAVAQQATIVEDRRRQLHDAVDQSEARAVREWQTERDAALRSADAARRARRHADLLTPGTGSGGRRRAR